jgi:hypothetical protein
MTSVWQGRVNTGVIDAIALAAAETAMPTAPALGVATTWSAFTAITSKLSEDDLSFTDSEGEILEVRPPGTIQNQGLVVIEPPGILRSIDVTHYEVGQKLFALASMFENLDDGETPPDAVPGLYAPTATITYKACIIQWAAMGWLYMPRVLVFPFTPSGGRKTLAKQVMRIQIEATDDYEHGYVWQHFQAAE